VSAHVRGTRDPITWRRSSPRRSGLPDLRRDHPVDVRISGDLAVVTYESQLEVTAGTHHVQHKAWHTHVYEKQDGQWLQVWTQATAVGGFPPPGS